jgi:fatty acid desaturase
MNRAPAHPSRIYGCTGPAAVRPLTRNDLAPEVRAEIRALQRLEPRRNLPLLVLVPLAIFGLWAALGPGIVIRAAGTIALTAVLVSLSVIMHEGGHHLLFRSRFLNRLVASACGAPVLISATAYRVLHLRHHAFERTERDPDDVETIARKGIPLVLVYYALLVTGTYLYLPHLAVGGWRAAHSRGERAAIALEYALMAGVMGGAWWLAPGIMMRIWLLPMLIAGQVTNLRGLAEHGLTTSGSPFTATRSVRTSPILALLLCNLNLHLEHHLFPAVPWYNLPRVHRLLLPAYRAAGSSVYDGYWRFLRDFLRTTWSGVVPDVRLLPAHQREELCA